MAKGEVARLNPHSYRTAAWFNPIASGIPLRLTRDEILIVPNVWIIFSKKKK